MLKVGGRQFDILEFDYSLYKETDPQGLPSSIIRGGKINILLESSDSSFFFEWICNGFEKKDGLVVLVKRDSEATMKAIEFKNAYLVSYNEKFSYSGNEPATESITLSAMEISVGNGTLQNEWHS